MTYNYMTPSDEEINDLRAEVADAKRITQYHQLKKELAKSTQQIMGANQEFEGSMQIPDTDKMLKANREPSSLVELFIERIRGMFSIKPIIGHIIAILLAGIVLFYIFNEVDAKWFVKYQAYFGIGVQFAAALAIIKSATRSLILPFAALFLGGMAAHTLHGHETLFHFGQAFYEHLMIVGIVGAAISIATID